MAYELSWYAPDKVLTLTLSGSHNASEAVEADQLIVQALEQSLSPLQLIIDARAMARPRNFQELRSALTFMNHGNLRRIIAIADDRVVMLAMIAIFNIARAPLTMLNDFHKAGAFLEREAVR